MTNKITKLALLLGLLALTSLLTYCSSAGSSDEPLTQEQMVERGKYLVMVGGCEDCHSPKMMTAKGPVPDPSLTLSGQPANAPVPEVPQGTLSPTGWMAMTNANMTAWAGPWGVSFAINLTPDENVGIGAWDADDFIKAMRTGQHLGMGRPILPPMPWQSIGKMKDEDLKAIFAYLQSLPAIPNQVPGPIEPKAN